MKIQLVCVSRRPAWPLWAVAIVLCWGAVVGAASVLGGLLGRSVNVCLFKRITGIACPTCGATRSALSLLGGDVAGALRCNPVLFFLGVVFSAGIVLRLVFGRKISFSLSRTEKAAAWGLAGAVVAANWCYLVFGGI